MIAAAVQKASGWGGFSFNWFDVAFVLLMAFGLWRGRKRGMSREILPVSFWLVVVIAGAFGYAWGGDLLIQSGIIRRVFGHSFNERTVAYLSSYLLIVLLVIFAYSFVKGRFKAKLEGSSAFGSSEYYLGMLTGVVRYACTLLAALAVLNAPVYSSAEIQAKQAYDRRWYGGDMFTGNYLPDLQTVQSSVFRDSFIGPFIKDNLSLLLVDTQSGGVRKPTASLQR